MKQQMTSQNKADSINIGDDNTIGPMSMAQARHIGIGTNNGSSKMNFLPNKARTRHRNRKSKQTKRKKFLNELISAKASAAVSIQMYFLCAFQAILNGPPTSILDGLCSKILEPIFAFMSHNKMSVRATATDTLLMIIKLTINNNKSNIQINDDTLFDVIVHSLSDEEEIVSKICDVITALSQVRHPAIYTKNHQFDLVTHLMPMRNLCVAKALNSIIYQFESNKDSHCVLKLVLEQCLKKILILAGAKSESRERVFEIISIVHTILNKDSNVALDGITLKTMMNHTIDLLQQQSDCSDIVVRFIHTFIKYIEGNSYLSSFLTNIHLPECLLNVLSDDGDDESVIIMCGIIKHLYTNCKAFMMNNEIRHFSDFIMKQLISTLKADGFYIRYESITSAILSVLQSNAINPMPFVSILDKCLLIASVRPPNNIATNQRLLAAFNGMRGNTVNMVCFFLVHYANANKINDFLYQYILSINSFFDAICSDNTIDENVFKTSMKLLAQIATGCDNTIKQKLRTQAILSLLNKGAVYPDNDLVIVSKNTFKTLSQNT